MDVKFDKSDSLCISFIFILFFLSFLFFFVILFPPHLLFAEKCRHLFLEIEKQKAAVRLIYTFSKFCIFVGRTFNDRS